MSKLSFQSALITAVAIAGFAVGRSWPAAPPDDRAYYVKALESSLGECQERLKARGASIEQLLALDVPRFQRSSPLAQTGTYGAGGFGLTSNNVLHP